MPATFRIHPAIGIARLGNSTSSFYIAPETPGALPIDCDSNGNPIVDGNGVEQRVSQFKDGGGAIRRQAARFRVFVYGDPNAPDGREITIGETLEIVTAQRQLQRVVIDDITWTAYLANKKASWYAFQETAGEHGYAPNHPLRNADVTSTQERQQLIIDPGPRSISFQGQGRTPPVFDASQGPASFPPPLKPNSISMLGELRCTQQNDRNRLLVLGGFGNSGSMKTGFGNPKIEEYANNDGWFDDIADGPVTAQLKYTVKEVSVNATTWVPAQPDSVTHKLPTGSVAVGDPAWVIVGYPRYAPEILDVVTMDDTIFDLAVRNFAFVPYMYGIPPFDAPAPVAAGLAAWRTRATWNPEFRPYFERDIRPILQRPFQQQYVMDFDAMSGGDPHQPGPGGNFDMHELSVPPHDGEDPVESARRRDMRQFIYAALRKQGQENDFYAPEYARDPNVRLFLMPRLCGDNPLQHLDTPPPSKFLRFSDTMLFMIKQWADGKFINEQLEDIVPGPMVKGEGTALDRGVLAAALGGSFCPGAEACWIMRNPAIYKAPYRIRQQPPVHQKTGDPSLQGALSLPANVPGTAPANVASLQNGLEPGDITKYDAVPWQGDFNMCSTQDIDITYRDWNSLYPESTGDPVQSVTTLTFWWPAHRPWTVNGTEWSPTPQTNAGNLQMVTQWAHLSFVTRNPEFGAGGTINPGDPVFITTEPS
jgi:hypothetical protein